MQSMYTVADLMGHLRVSRSRLYELIADGLRPSLYLGSSPRWTEGAVTDFLAAQPTSRCGKPASKVGGTK